jgi:hypothetical protein
VQSLSWIMDGGSSEQVAAFGNINRGEAQINSVLGAMQQPYGGSQPKDTSMMKLNSVGNCGLTVLSSGSPLVNGYELRSSAVTKLSSTVLANPAEVTSM